jgi:protein-disulfide isomerase
MKHVHHNHQAIGTCPLCHESFPRAELHQHVAAERREIVRHTIKVIKRMHPAWQQADGACRQCWEFYEKLGSLGIAPAAMQEATVS